MAAPQELYAANSGSSSGRSWAGQLTSERASAGLLLPCKLDKIAPPAAIASCCKGNLFCFLSGGLPPIYPLTDFFTQRRLVCSWETTYLSRQSD